MNIALEMLEKGSDGTSYQQLFKALCVIEKEQIVPIHILQKLWDRRKLAKLTKLYKSYEQCRLRKDIGRMVALGYSCMT